jgi:hypothetical protein
VQALRLGKNIRCVGECGNEGKKETRTEVHVESPPI